MLTEDIKPAWRNWLNIVRRLQGAGCKQDGLAIAKIVIVLNGEGEPVFWLNPDVKLIEPKNRIKEEDIRAMTNIFGDRVIDLLLDN